jgi:hypothetical protein
MRTVLSVLLVTLVTAAPLTAQSEQDVSAYFTLIGTPPGALPAVLSIAMLNRPMTLPNVAVRYGHISTAGVSFNSFAATLGVPAGTKALIGLTAGYQALSCQGGGCNGHFIGGASAEGRLTSTTLGTGSDAAQLTIGLNGEFGYGKPESSTLVSLTGGVPIALVAGGPEIKIAPFLRPAIGWGREGNAFGNTTGTRFMLGGGVTFLSTTSGVGANIGFQKVFINGGDTLFGVSLILGAR